MGLITSFMSFLIGGDLEANIPSPLSLTGTHYMLMESFYQQDNVYIADMLLNGLC